MWADGACVGVGAGFGVRAGVWGRDCFRAGAVCGMAHLMELGAVLDLIPEPRPPFR